MPDSTSMPAVYRCALVTGATSGIGKAVVMALRDAGLQVIAVGRSREALDALEAEKGVITLEADVRQTEAFFLRGLPSRKWIRLKSIICST
jgi:NADP-dependent 3-hydroxy acid dehydrogenase YdfG